MARGAQHRGVLEQDGDVYDGQIGPLNGGVYHCNNITVPAGYIFGLPVGISFFGRAWSEPKLLKIAYGYEQATKHRVAPRFLRTLDLG